MMLAAAGLIFVLFKPRWMLIVVLVMFPLEQLLQSYVPALRGSNSAITNVTIALLAGFAVGMRLLRKEPIFMGWGNPVTYAVFGTYLWLAVTLLHSPGRGAALELLTHAAPYMVLMLIVLPLLVRDLEDFRKMCIAVVLLGGGICTLILLNPNFSLTGGRFGAELGAYEGQEGGRGNPLALGDLAGLTALFAAIVIPARTGWLFVAIRVGAFIPAMALGIYSGSRGQVLAAIAVIMLAYPFSRRVANIPRALATIVGAGVLAIAFYFSFRMFVGGENLDRWNPALAGEALGGRFLAVLTLAQAWLENPAAWVIGLGTQAFNTFNFPGMGYVHNQPAEILFELGLIGFAFFLVAAIGTAVAGYNLFALYKDDAPSRSAVVVLCAMCLYIFLLSLKQGTMASVPYLYVWWIVMAKIWWTEKAALQQAAMYGESAADLADDAYPYEDLPQNEYGPLRS